MDTNNNITELLKECQQFADLENSSKKLQPKEETLEFILNYSKALKVYKTEQIEHVEVLLN